MHTTRLPSTRLPGYLDAPTIPVAYLQLLVELMGERDIAPGVLFDSAKVPADLVREQRMSALQWTRLVRSAQDLSGDPGLGYEFGTRMRPTAHGLLGYAAMSANSVRAACEIVVRYASARQAHFDISLEEDAEYGQLTLRERFPIPVMRTFFVENILLGLARGFAVPLEREQGAFSDYEICFDTSEPDYYPAWRERLGRVRFDCRVNAVRFPVHYLSLRPALADPYASQQACALCEQELRLAQKDGLGLPARVVAELRRDLNAPGYPSLETVASRMFLSSRTLKRRLQEQGTSFLRLLNDTRTCDACTLLAQSELSVQTIAGRLGYENPANFTRAFVQQVGETPSSYRAAHRGKS